jgi:hypothetical protein
MASMILPAARRGVEKLDEFLMGMSGHAAPNDPAVEDVEGGK